MRGKRHWRPHPENFRSVGKGGGSVTSLAVSRLTGRPVAGNSALAQAKEVAPDPTPVVQGNRPDLSSIVLPKAQDRWLANTLRKFKPDDVARIFAGSLSGDLTHQFELFNLMEESTPRLAKNLNQVKDAV